MTAYSGEPTPMPSATVTTIIETPAPVITPSPVTTPVALNLRFADFRFTWDDVPGETGYVLSGRVSGLVGRSGDSYCDAQRRQDPFTINLDETLPAGTTSFDLPAAPVPDGVLFLVAADVTLQALAGQGQIAQDVLRTAAQPTECVPPNTPTPQPRVGPPETGSAGIR